MKLLIITPTLNEVKKIIDHLEHLTEQLDVLRKVIKCDCFFIDGGSTDPTPLALKQGLFPFSLTKGTNIYEAFNIGLSYAFEQSYDHVMFLGVGDRINAVLLSSVLSGKILPLKPLKQSFLVFSDFSWSNRKYTVSRFQLVNGLMGFPHSGTIFPLSVFKENLFNENYKIAGDLEWMYRSLGLLASCSISHVNRPFVTLECGGVSMSTKKKFVHLLEFIVICIKHRTWPSLRFIILKLFK